jgi:hypothetical protein
MADMKKLMIPEPIKGEPFRYYVHSETVGNETHVVDLASNNGNGECSCTDFQMRRGPNLNKNGGVTVHYYLDKDGKVGKDATTCKHIHSAMLEFAVHTARSVCVQERAKPQTIRESDDGLPF